MNDLIKESEISRAQLVVLTARLQRFVAELKTETARDDGDIERLT